MKVFFHHRLLFAVPLCFSLSVAAQSGDYPIQPVPFTQVQVTDAFWKPRLEKNVEVTIPYTLGQCERTGRMDNFRRAAGWMPVDTVTTFPFDDTDLYKLIEGASYSLQTRPDKALEAKLDSLIALIGAAQEPDGYLYTFRTMKAKHDWVGEKRWVKTEDLSHELYNSGHLFEAAAAHFLATGKRNLLDIALKNADLLVNTFGWGKLEYYPGHQVVETGLTRLYRITQNKAYLDLAKFYLDLRGKPGHFNREYSQAHIPVVDQHAAVGHAVRAAYMYTGMADVAALTGDAKYIRAIDDIWQDVVSHKIYITGGIGATGNGEAFGAAYELPNMSAYAETCASIANVYWNNRMFLLHGHSQYIDVLERVLYNGLLSGVSLSGDRFFYPNPLASMGQHQRSAWFNCACCISNMTRFLPSMPGYIYAQNANDLYVNLFVGSEASIKLPATDLKITQQTNYPWEGDLRVTVDPAQEATFTLHIRIPGWAQDKPTPGDLYRPLNLNELPVIVKLNGNVLSYVMKNGYLVLNRHWKKGDQVELSFPMDVKKMLSIDSVNANRGRMALQRGPLVYCLEGPDHAEGAVMNLMMDKNAAVETRFKPDLLSGVMALQFAGVSLSRQMNSDALVKKETRLQAIPYYAWANRGPSEMQVWIPYEESAAKPKPAPTIASKSQVSSSLKNSKMNKALNDQYDPQDSKDASTLYLHWWPTKNTTEWVQYDFDKEYTVSESRVYWFDDGPWGGCRIPAGWKLFYKKGDSWIPVKAIGSYSVTKDAYDHIQFEPVKTRALKLEVILPTDHSTGIHEWIVR